MSKIFVSIASYCDEELKDTVFSILSRAKNTKDIFLCVLSQESSKNHQKIDVLIKSFGIKDFMFLKMDAKDAKGVGYARAKILENLSLDYKYFLQIDSHTQFVQDWDEQIVNDYEKSVSRWGDMIFSAYPGSYEYDDSGNIRVNDKSVATALRIQKTEHGAPTFYEPKYRNHNQSEFGDYHGYFCAGMAFGYSNYFLRVPYDKYMYFNGEEQTMSIRMFCNDIKLIAPPRNYVFHHYTGKKRIRHWENADQWKVYDEMGKKRLLDFFDNKIKNIFGITDYDKYLAWQKMFVMDNRID